MCIMSYDSWVCRFDAHKLDISDEFKDVITGLGGLENKVRCVLNKADQINSEELVRVYGALMFNIAKILQTPVRASLKP